MSISGLFRRVSAALDHVVRGNLWTVIDNRWRAARGVPRRLLRRPPGAKHVRGSAQTLNRLLELMGGGDGRLYLEIGVQQGLTLERVAASTRVGVEPEPRFQKDDLPDGVAVYVGTSDEYFRQLGEGIVFDLVFVDGLHLAEYAYRDVVNALSALKPGGAVLIDDTVPVDRWASLRDESETHLQRRIRNLPPGGWQGDVWRVLLALDAHHSDLDWRTFHGAGGAQTLLWRKVEGTTLGGVLSVRAASLPEVDSSYEKAFGDGWPVEARRASETDAIDEWARSRSIIGNRNF